MVFGGKAASSFRPSIFMRAFSFSLGGKVRGGGWILRTLENTFFEASASMLAGIGLILLVVGLAIGLSSKEGISQPALTVNDCLVYLRHGALIAPVLAGGKFPNIADYMFVAEMMKSAVIVAFQQRPE